MATERDYLEAVAGRCNPLDDDKCFDCKAVAVAALYVKQLQDENKKLKDFVQFVLSSIVLTSNASYVFTTSPGIFKSKAEQAVKGE